MMTDPMIPLADRIRPRTIEEMVGQKHLLNPDSVLVKAIRSDRLFSVIFWGPPGSGKTTLARLMARENGNPFYHFSAVTSGVKELRQIIDEAKKRIELQKRPTILFVDEIHRFNKAQQDAFLPHVESGLIILIGATTQNPSFEVIPPLLSRSRVMTLHPLEEEEIETLVNRAIRDKEDGLGEMGLTLSPGALNFLISLSQGDARVALNNLELAAHYAVSSGEKGVVIDLKLLSSALQRKALPYDKDGEEHYNLISALHKSLRGSDAQASLYWLYRMLLAGEDPLFIARRMIRCASEDIGLADPNALQVALAAFETWEKIGPPEGELALAQAAVYLAAAPKSNALYLAEKAVKAEIETTGALPVPLHIRNAPNSLMKKQGYGKGYRYPHNYPGARVKQAYLPEKVRNRHYYRPTDRGIEGRIRRRISERDKKDG